MCPVKTLLDSILDDWQLTPTGDPLGSRAEVVAVRTVDNRRAVLRLAEPTGWHRGTIPALKAWRTHGAVEVLRAAPAKGAVLLEPLEPAGLWGDDELDALALLWQALHVPAPASVPTVDELLSPALDDIEAAGRRSGLPPQLAQQAVALGRDLLGHPGPQVLVHGALHADHVMLRGGGVAAISPLGFAGDAECEAAAAFDLVTGGVPEIQDHAWALLDALAAADVEVDEHRFRDWTVVLSAVRAFRSTENRRRTHLLTVAKAIGAMTFDDAVD